MFVGTVEVSVPFVHVGTFQKFVFASVYQMELELSGSGFMDNVSNLSTLLPESPIREEISKFMRPHMVKLTMNRRSRIKTEPSESV